MSTKAERIERREEFRTHVAIQSVERLLKERSCVGCGDELPQNQNAEICWVCLGWQTGRMTNSERVNE